jgi:hypothetical protein
MEFQGSIEEKCEKLYAFSKNNFEQLQSYLVRFINSQKERIDKKVFVQPWSLFYWMKIIQTGDKKFFTSPFGVVLYKQF